MRWVEVPSGFVDEVVVQSGDRRSTASIIHRRLALFSRACELMLRPFEERLETARVTVILEGFMSLGGAVCLKVKRADSPGRLVLSLWFDDSLANGLEERGALNAASRISVSLRCLLPHLIRYFGSEEEYAGELRFD